MSKPIAFVVTNKTRYTVVLRRDHAVDHWQTSYTLKPHSSVMVDARAGETFRMEQVSAGLAYGDEDLQKSYAYVFGKFQVPNDASPEKYGSELPVYNITEKDFVERNPMPAGTHMLNLHEDENYMHEVPNIIKPLKAKQHIIALLAGMGTVLVLGFLFFLYLHFTSLSTKIEL